MGCCRVCMLSLGVLSLLLGYYLYQPIPAGIEAPVTTWALANTARIMMDVAWLGSKLGFGSVNVLHRRILIGSMAAFAPPTPDHIRTSVVEFGGVPVRLHERLDRPRPSGAVIYYHSGGWLWGSSEMYDSHMTTLADYSSLLVIVVDYRLAPENPYPIPLDDCVQASTHFLKNAARYGVDPQRVAVMGDSAGGNLAAAVALKLRALQDLVQPKLQVLINAGLQAFDFDLPSYRQNSQTNIIVARRAVAECMLQYMGEENLEFADQMLIHNHTSPETRKDYSALVSTKFLPEKYINDLPSLNQKAAGSYFLAKKFEKFVLDPFFMPLMASNLQKLPKTYIVTSEFDVYRDDGMIYAERLRQAGVDVTLYHIEDGFHASIWFMNEKAVKFEGSVKAYTNLIQFLKQNL